MSVQDAALSSLRETFAGEIVLPGDQEYEAARAVWNGMIDRRPAIVLRPTDAADVSTAIGFAREQELDIAVKSGGHSIPGLSTCDDGAVIDLSRMRGVQVDPERRVAQVNGGSLLSELDEQAQAFGLVCPVGVVGHTGVAGLTLGGGMGRLQRRFGLTIDNLLSVEVATATGRLVRASDEENPDLFWGLRGAGPNFGIATSFEFRLHPFGGVVTHGRLIHPIERAAELASILRETDESAPDELWLGFGLGLALPVDDFPVEVAGEPIAIVQVLHCGPVEQAERELAKLRAFGPPLVDSIEPKQYLMPQGMSDEAMRWGHRFYMKSGFVPGLTDELVEVLVEHVPRVPDGADGGISFWAMGHAISAVPEEATAFSGRAAAFWVASEILWDDEELDERCREWSRAVMDDVLPFSSTGRYVNDVSEAGEDLGASIYGAAKYERLVALKRAWDPENVFRLNQNVRP
jgi:FAD/FMN-containing dehydrogenase